MLNGDIFFSKYLFSLGSYKFLKELSKKLVDETNDQRDLVQKISIYVEIYKYLYFVCFSYICIYVCLYVVT